MLGSAAGAAAPWEGLSIDSPVIKNWVQILGFSTGLGSAVATGGGLVGAALEAAPA